jgi:putative transposase
MKLIAQLKLYPTPQQAAMLRATMERTNAACNHISQVAWQTRTFAKFALQKLCYTTVREQFGLSAQVTVRALAKVGDAYKLDTKAQRTFRPLASIAYDDRILSYNLHKSTVSIWTLDGRQTLPFVCGERQRVLLQSRMGESDLVERQGEWYLLATCDLPDPAPQDVDDALGIDLGISAIASDSDGTIYSGSTIKNVRYRHRRLRKQLQKKGTLSAKRRLRCLSGQEARFARDINHTISKRLVSTAERTKRALALEDLKGICTRIRAGRQQRTILHSWSFHQLRAFIVYKAQRVGIR